MNRGSAPPPRNYFGIPEAETVRRDRPAVHHDRLLAGGEALTGAVELGIRILEPVHVGSGAFGLHGERIVKEPVRRGGLLVIPGSSLKGMCRQLVEALTLSDSPFHSSAKYRAPRHGSPPRPLSSAAALFGTLGYQGRVSFDDGVPVDPGGQGNVPEPTVLEPEEITLSVPYPPQKAVGRRFYGDLPDEADQPPSIPAVAIPRGSLLISNVRFRNLAREELGEVLLGLGAGRFAPRLGGGKYDGFGRVEIRPRAHRLRHRGFGPAQGWERRPAEVAAFVEECVAAVELDETGRKVLSVLEEKFSVPVEDEEGGRHR